MDNGMARTKTMSDATGDFEGRAGAALVAGGTGGIGSAIVRLLAERGSAVAFTYRANATAADELSDEVTTMGRKTLALQVDLADEPSTTGAVARVAEAFGGIHTLVYAAG